MKERFLFYRVNVDGARFPVNKAVQFSIPVYSCPAPACLIYIKDTAVGTKLAPDRLCHILIINLSMPFGYSYYFRECPARGEIYPNYGKSRVIDGFMKTVIILTPSPPLPSPPQADSPKRTRGDGIVLQKGRRG